MTITNNLRTKQTSLYKTQLTNVVLVAISALAIVSFVFLLVRRKITKRLFTWGFFIIFPALHIIMTLEGIHEVINLKGNSNNINFWILMALTIGAATMSLLSIYLSFQYQRNVIQKIYPSLETTESGYTRLDNEEEGNDDDDDEYVDFSTLTDEGDKEELYDADSIPLQKLGDWTKRFIVSWLFNTILAFTTLNVLYFVMFLIRLLFSINKNDTIIPPHDGSTAILCLVIIGLHLPLFIVDYLSAKQVCTKMRMMSLGLTTHQPMRVICVKMVN